MIKQDLKNLRKTIDRRSFIFASAQGLAFAVLAGRLYYLQIIKGEHYAVLSDKNRIRVRLLAPKRGAISDRHGTTLAGNRDSYSIFTDPKNRESLHRSLELIDPNQQRPNLSRAIPDDLSWEQVARLASIASELPGITIGKSHLRTYPLGPGAAHAVGYIGKSPDLRLPSEFKVGRSGVERGLEKILTGGFGSKKLEVDALGREIRELEHAPPSVGKRVVLTLDASIQQKAHELFATRSGAAVMLDCRNGEVLLSYSSPTFEPEALSHGKVSPSHWQRLAGNRKNPMLDRTLHGFYAPGSVFKVVVALAALRKGVAFPHSSFFCPGYLDYGDRRFHCWEEKGHGKVDLGEAIKRSCDVYFYQLAKKVGIAEIASTARQMGLGEAINIWPLKGGGGLLPTPRWKKRNRGDPWLVSDTMMTAIGQGFLLASPMQLALAASWFANGGRRVHPYLLAADAPPPLPRAEGDLHLRFVRRSMSRVVNEGGGTAYGGRIRKAEYAMAGKTGTSQVRSISLAERESGILKNNQLPWHQRDHALFIGYAPEENPVYAVSVVLEHGGSSMTAAKTAAALLEHAQKNRISEKESARPQTESHGGRS